MVSTTITVNDVKQQLQEAWYNGNVANIVDPRERFTDSPGFGWLARRFGLYTQIDYRSDGRFAPVYDNEYDLKAIRWAAWLMDAEVPVAKAAKERLTDYTISGGFDWTIQHPSKRIETLCNRIVKRFFDNCNWTELERESFKTEFVDGEFIGELVADCGDITLEPLQGDNLQEPANTRELEDWKGIDFPCSWSFGVLTKENRTRPLAYHIVRNAEGSDWGLKDECEMVHWKRNAPIAAKRGYSDHYATHKVLRHGEKIIERTAVGSAIQASIAYILENAPGVSNSQAAALAARRPNVVTNVDSLGQQVKSERIDAGQIIRISSGQKYYSGLLGSNASNIYIEVMDACFRIAGTPYAFPEHFLTGYAGNNNLASSLTAQDPFIQGRMADQQIRAERVEKLIRKIILFALKNSGIGIDVKEVMIGLSIVAQPPRVITQQDNSELTTALVAQLEAKLIDRKSAINMLGYDPETIEEGLRNEAEQGGGPEGEQGQPGQQPPGTMLNVGRRQYKNAKKAMSEVLAELEDGSIDANRARVMLGEIGYSKAAIDQLIPSDEPTDESGAPAGQEGEKVADLGEQMTKVLSSLSGSRALHNLLSPVGKQRLREQIVALGGGDHFHLLEVKDGDGDGLVDDGKPTERAATKAEKAAGKKGKQAEPNADPIADAGSKVAAKFKHAGPYKSDGEFVRKKNLSLDEAQDAINARAADFVSKLKESGASVGGGKVTALNTGEPNPRHEAEIAKATDFLKSVVGPNVKADIKWQMGTGMREEYSPATGTIKMTGLQPIHSAFIHEAAHHIERTNPEVAAGVKAFLAERTKQFKSKPVKMQSFNRGYSPKEVGNDAGFAKAMGSPERGAYTGMVYPDGATEVLSMGLQRLHSNPAKFFKDDPQYAAFVIKVLNQ